MTLRATRDQAISFALRLWRSAAVLRARPLRADGGAIGLEIAVLLAVPVVAATAVAASLMRAGDAASGDLQSAVSDAMGRAGSGIQSNDLVLARTDGTRITHVLVDVITTAGSPPVSLDPDAVTARTTASYIDSATVERNLPYTVNWITGNGDSLLEGGEVAQIDIDVSGIASRDDRFTVEIRPAYGAYVSLQIRIPSGNPFPPILRVN